MLTKIKQSCWQSQSLLNNNNQVISDDSDIRTFVTGYFKSFFTSTKGHCQHHWTDPSLQQGPNPLAHLDVSFDLDEIDNAMQQVDSFKSLALDGVQAQFLQKGLGSYKEFPFLPF